MKRLTEYTVELGWRTSWRRAASPTRIPAGVKLTIEGSSARPSASGITRGSPVRSSTYATRLLVVPRSIPTMGGMGPLLLVQCFAEVRDHRAQIGARGERRLERLEHRRPLRGVGGVPRLAQLTGQTRLFLSVTLSQPVALLPERLSGGVVEHAGPGLGQRLLDLEHLGQQLGRGLRLHDRALARLPALFEPDQVFDAGDRIAERAVRRVEPRRGVQRSRLFLGRRPVVEVGMVPARQLIESPLQLGPVDVESPRESEHLEVVQG